MFWLKTQTNTNETIARWLIADKIGDEFCNATKVVTILDMARNEEIAEQSIRKIINDNKLKLKYYTSKQEIINDIPDFYKPTIRSKLNEIDEDDYISCFFKETDELHWNYNNQDLYNNSDLFITTSLSVAHIVREIRERVWSNWNRPWGWNDDFMKKTNEKVIWTLRGLLPAPKPTLG